jgi:diguanylate cyclase (GGDEF)-like protein
LLYIDLDNFKNINDNLGHSKGDLVLIDIAHRLQECVRSIDTVCRIGGDEFAILLEDIVDVSSAEDITARILKTLAKPVDIEGRSINISTSIGIRINQIGDEFAEDLLRDADIAMYQAKSHGKSCYLIFDVGMRDHVLERLELENDLQNALNRQPNNRELLLYYQPIVSLSNGKVMGFEALSRWKHPKRGMISPNIFIPIAEETGLIGELGEWALREACHQAHIWNETYSNNLLRTISVNLSARQFSQTDIFLQVKQILEESNLPPQCLKLEITENLLIEDPDSIIHVLEKLRDLGVQVQIDDFGKGYSSLSYLHQLPIDAFKIDRSFISRLDEASEDPFAYEVVRTMIALARELKIKVVAEGVEKREQYNLLQDLGCDYIQGYLIAEPMEKTLLEVFLDAVNK